MEWDLNVNQNDLNKNADYIDTPTYSIDETTDESSQEALLISKDRTLPKFFPAHQSDLSESHYCDSIKFKPNNNVLSNVDTKLNNNKLTVNLQPFLHQVGGHLCMLKFDKHTICKPLQNKEKEFYKYDIPSRLKPYIAAYYGTVEVLLEKDKKGYFNLVSPILSLNKSKSFNGLPDKILDLPLNSHQQKYRTTTSFNDKYSTIKVRMKCTGSLEVLDPLNLNLFEKADTSILLPPCSNTNISNNPNFNTNMNSIKTSNTSLNNVIASTTVSTNTPQQNKRKSYSFNPWSLKRHREQILAMQRDNHIKYKFIRLQDLTSAYNFPCVLDLKMGIRQYGDDASEQKRISQIAKCEASTSGSLGVRICGMQVYQPEKGAFLCYDKYIGRKLTIQGFEESLRLFFQTALSFCNNSKASKACGITPTDCNQNFIRDINAENERCTFYKLCPSEQDLTQNKRQKQADSFRNQEFRALDSGTNIQSLSGIAPTTPPFEEYDVVDCKHSRLDGVIDMMAMIINQLKDLRSILAQLPTYRFYSSSLLVLYEGNPAYDTNRYKDYIVQLNKHTDSDALNQNQNVFEHNLEPGWPAQINMVDFAHSSSNIVFPSSCHDNSEETENFVECIISKEKLQQNIAMGKVDGPGPDRGYLYGLDNLISIMEKIHKEYE